MAYPFERLPNFEKGDDLHSCERITSYQKNLSHFADSDQEELSVRTQEGTDGEVSTIYLRLKQFFLTG